MEQQVKILNTLTREKEVFKPISENHIGMYVCGPTVYGEPHLGNARPSITFDVVFRYFQHIGYKVRYVRNITDVGHLEDELADVGEDKIAKKAKLEKLEPMELVHRYTRAYHKTMEQLNVLSPSIEPTATGHIIEQIEIIEKILERGYAYESDGSVYFDMESYTKDFKYGELSGKVIEDLLGGSRDLDGQEEKKKAADFALWKKASPEHIMKWNSPWSLGFPGWHLECTAMSTKYLGKTFDIHGGGMDLQFPHHEGEIAQSHSAFGCKPANYWMHNNMVTIDGKKMAKSKGNFVTLNELFTGSHDLLEQAYSPMTIRFFMLQAHYGGTIDFSNSALQAAEKGYKRLMNAIPVLNKLVTTAKDDSSDAEINKQIDELYEYMNDDFNTAKVLSVLFDLASKIYTFRDKPETLSLSGKTMNRLKEEFNIFLFNILGLIDEGQEESGDKTSGLIEMLIDIRKKAKDDKDWALSDKVRDDLIALGIQLKDEKDGTTSFSLL